MCSREPRVLESGEHGGKEVAEGAGAVCEECEGGQTLGVDGEVGGGVREARSPVSSLLARKETAYIAYLSTWFTRLM